MYLSLIKCIISFPCFDHVFVYIDLQLLYILYSVITGNGKGQCTGIGKLNLMGTGMMWNKSGNGSRNGNVGMGMGGNGNSKTTPVHLYFNASRRGRYWDGRLSWPGWLVTYRDSLLGRRQSLIQVVTGPGEEQLSLSRPISYGYAKPPPMHDAMQINPTQCYDVCRASI